MKKYMILCIAGQSNAVGYDESYVPDDYLNQFDTSRIVQLGLYREDNLKIIPLGVCAQSYQDLRQFSNLKNTVPNLGTKGMHLPLANLLLKDIPEDYDILVISCAYGGAGFTVGQKGTYDKEQMMPSLGIGQWGVEEPYYLGMKDRIAYVLNLNPENKFLGVVWVQGEHDNQNAKGQKAGFEAMTEDFFSTFGKEFPNRVYKGEWNRNIWYNVETVAYWYTQGQCVEIWDNYKKWNPNTYVEIPRDTDSNAVNGTGRTAMIRGSHYGNDAYLKVIAPRIEENMRKRFE